MPESLIPSDAVKAIQDSVSTEIITVDGENFSTRKIYQIPSSTRDPIESVELSTLDGLLKYVLLIPDPDPSSYFRISSPTRVQFEAPPDSSNNQSVQDVYAIADCSNLTRNTYKVGDYLTQEMFIINLMTNFVDSADRARMLAYVGNLEDTKSVRTEDDGVSQSSTVRKGIRRIGEESVGPIIQLAPYRSFREIEQPESSFLFRMRPLQERCVALFEADGAAWNLEAIERLKLWLTENQETDYPVIA